MVFQQPNPFPFSIYENVIYGLKLKGEKDKQTLDQVVEESLKAASVWDDVKDKLHKSALSLSGGQQQRVCIARVLAVNPEIILLDEPTSALDPISTGKIESMLLELRERYTMIMVTHNMSQASRISDKTAFFLDGHLIEFMIQRKSFYNQRKKKQKIIFLVNSDRRETMLRTQFEEELLNLHNQFYEMGMMVSSAVHKSVRSYIKHDKTLAKEVIDNDVAINDMEVRLEKKSFEMIALQQPVTTDLRMIITVMKASSDLERMADHAVSIAKSTIRVKGETRIPEIEKEISDMSDYVKKMVDNVLVAYVKTDEKDARTIANMDQRVNEYFNQIYNSSIKNMENHPETVVSGTDYLHVATYLERIADYVTNICEWIVYLATGKITELNTNHDE